MKPPPEWVELPAILVARLCDYERNCRCPKCHGGAGETSGPLPCVECDWCVANMQRLIRSELEASGCLSSFSSCIAESDRAKVHSMKKTTGTTKLKSKATAKKKITGKVKAAKKPVAKAVGSARKPVTSERKKPVSIAAGRRKGGDSDRGLYVRFGDAQSGPGIKAKVEKAAEGSGLKSMNAYIVASTLYCMENNVKLLPEPVAATA
jgi:hypothetical protein